jgi:hypothetical protein
MSEVPHVHAERAADRVACVVAGAAEVARADVKADFLNDRTADDEHVTEAAAGGQCVEVVSPVFLVV